jgi:DNA-binding XRE family transcriptional regulator
MKWKRRNRSGAFLCSAEYGTGDTDCICEKVAKNTTKTDCTGAQTNERGFKMSRPTSRDFEKEALSRPEVKAEFDRLAPAYELRQKMIEIRKAAGFTQEQMARVLDTQKSNISRLENVHSRISPTLSTIERYASAAGCRLEIRFVPRDCSESRSD